jgi:hypothetical protein
MSIEGLDDTVLRYGDSGEQVLLLQRALNMKAGAKIKPDGDFGKLTETALRAFQSTKGLEQNGIYGEKEQEILAPFIVTKFITSAAIIEEAKKLNIPESMLLAVKDVEAKSAGYLDDGRPLILFERHKMYSQVSKKRGIEFANNMMKVYPDVINPAKGGYLGYEREWDRINKAKSIDEECALMSASWGLFQIMGFNHNVCKIPTVREFVRLNEESEIQQFKLFINFLTTQPELLAAARQRNHLRFAQLYNGSAQKGYDVKLRDAEATYLMCRR